MCCDKFGDSWSWLGRLWELECYVQNLNKTFSFKIFFFCHKVKENLPEVNVKETHKK